MCQKHFTTAIACKTNLFHDVGLLGLGDRRAVEVGTLAISVTLKFLETSLIIEPLISEALATVHTPDRNNHLTTLVVCLPRALSTLGGLSRLSLSVKSSDMPKQECHLRCLLAEQ
jgi:hypothetical protein